MLLGLRACRWIYTYHPAVCVSRRILNGLQRPLDDSDGIKPTMLYPHKGDVNQENQKHFMQLDSTTEHLYVAINSSDGEAQRLDREISAQPYAPAWQSCSHAL